MSNTVRESLATTQKVGIFMFMLGTIPILGASVSTTLVLMSIHGEPSQPAPVVDYIFLGTMLFAITGAAVYGLSLVNWDGVRQTVSEVLSR